jgi:hypothetical protein
LCSPYSEGTAVSSAVIGLGRVLRTPWFYGIEPVVGTADFLLVEDP